MSDAIRWFIGCDGGDCDLESMMVAEFSARKRCSMPIDITWMRQSRKGFYSGWSTASGRTPFSHYRYSLPAACDFHGRALYTDVDFIIQADLAELWNQPIPNVLLLKSPEGKLKTCAMLIDCDKAKGHFWELSTLRASDDVNGKMTNYLRANKPLLSAFDGDWNCIDGASYPSIHDPRIKAIHYSRIEHQVNLKHAIPRLKAEGKEHWYKGEVFPHPRAELQALFDAEYAEALAAGYTLDQYRSDAPVEAVRRNFTYGQRGQVAS